MSLEDTARNASNPQIHDNAKLDNVPHYQFCCSPRCIFRRCWHPGKRTTDSIGVVGEVTYGRILLFEKNEVYVCTWMFDHGCPDEPEEDQKLGIERFEDGWQSSSI